MECKYLVYNYKHKEGCSELIDTLWNVNQQYPQYPQYPQPGINRYIMECK